MYNHVTGVLILTEECSDNLNSCLLWGKPSIPWMYNHVAGVLILMSFHLTLTVVCDGAGPFSIVCYK